VSPTILKAAKGQINLFPFDFGNDSSAVVLKNSSSLHSISLLPSPSLIREGQFAWNMYCVVAGARLFVPLPSPPRPPLGWFERSTDQRERRQSSGRRKNPLKTKVSLEFLGLATCRARNASNPASFLWPRRR
jgi:hypothetical protein